MPTFFTSWSPTINFISSELEMWSPLTTILTTGQKLYCCCTALSLQGPGEVMLDQPDELLGGKDKFSRQGESSGYCVSGLQRGFQHCLQSDPHREAVDEQTTRWQKKTTRNAKSHTWGGKIPGTRTCWGQPAGNWLCRKGPGGHQAGHEPARCPCC